MDAGLLDGHLGGLLPGVRARADDLHDLVDAVRHVCFFAGRLTVFEHCHRRPRVPKRAGLVRPPPIAASAPGRHEHLSAPAAILNLERRHRVPAPRLAPRTARATGRCRPRVATRPAAAFLSLIHISEPTRRTPISYA